MILGSTAEVLAGRNEACWVYRRQTLEWQPERLSGSRDETLKLKEALAVINGTSAPNRFTLRSNMTLCQRNVCFHSSDRFSLGEILQSKTVRSNSLRFFSCCWWRGSAQPVGRGGRGLFTALNNVTATQILRRQRQKRTRSSRWIFFKIINLIVCEFKSQSDMLP